MSFAIYPSLEGRSVLVTGGASGIGASIVRAFHEQRSRVGFCDIDAQAGQALAAELGDNVAFAKCDLRDAAAIGPMVETLTASVGAPTVLVNNAARDDRHGWDDERIAVNLRHMFFVTQAVAPGMIAAGGGSIVNFGSCSWMQGQGGMPVYTTAKAAVHGMTRSFARDLGPHRIRVNTVVPGWIMTERQKELWVTPEAMQEHLKRQCLPDPIDPVYVARITLFLASDDAAACTANNYMVEGGSI